MTEPQYINPNSGAAPQPGGMVVGGAESQRGAAEEERLAASQEAYLAEDPTSSQEAELQRQVEVTQNQSEAKQGSPDASDPNEAETPNLAESTAGTPAGEATSSTGQESSKVELVDDSSTKDDLTAIAKDENVEGYSTLNKPDLIEAINDKRKADAAK